VSSIIVTKACTCKGDSKINWIDVAQIEDFLEPYLLKEKTLILGVAFSLFVVLKLAIIYPQSNL
jgi:hypothetical protein